MKQYSKKSNKKSQACDSQDSIFNQISVLLAGFPTDANTADVDIFMKKIAPNKKCSIIKRKKYTLEDFRGFVFVHFENIKEAETFNKKKHFYNDMLLDCKLLNNHDNFINESIENAKNPVKVQVEQVPQSMTKETLTKLFCQFGVVKELVIVTKENKDSNFIYITYDSHESAKYCVNQSEFHLENGEVLKFSYAKPKFSSHMIQKVHPQLAKYQKKVQHRLMAYDPQEFSELHDYILEKEAAKLNSGVQTFSKFSYLNSDDTSIKSSLFSKKYDSKDNQSKDPKNTQSYDIKKSKQPKKIKSAFSSPFINNRKLVPGQIATMQNDYCGNYTNVDTGVIDEKKIYSQRQHKLESVNMIPKNNLSNLIQFNNCTKNTMSLRTQPYGDPQGQFQNQQMHNTNIQSYNSFGETCDQFMNQGNVTNNNVHIDLNKVETNPVHLLNVCDNNFTPPSNAFTNDTLQGVYNPGFTNQVKSNMNHNSENQFQYPCSVSQYDNRQYYDHQYNWNDHSNYNYQTQKNTKIDVPYQENYGTYHYPYNMPLSQEQTNYGYEHQNPKNQQYNIDDSKFESYNSQYPEQVYYHRENNNTMNDTNITTSNNEGHNLYQQPYENIDQYWNSQVLPEGNQQNTQETNCHNLNFYEQFPGDRVYEYNTK